MEHKDELQLGFVDIKNWDVSMVLLWLDDMRNPFEDGWLKEFAPNFDLKRVVWVRNYEDFVSWISDFGLPNTIAFDHDLGEDVAKERVAGGMSKRAARILKRDTVSGLECAKWLVGYCYENNKPLPNYIVQSANLVGKQNIIDVLSNK